VSAHLDAVCVTTFMLPVAPIQVEQPILSSRIMPAFPNTALPVKEQTCCDVLDRMPSLLGNGKLNTSMDTGFSNSSIWFHCNQEWETSTIGRPMFLLGQPDVI
jgi:hypothetical protein